jgi:hypothetical protein
MSDVTALVNALLYEGYMLYPYRPSSIKNRQRWTIGGLHAPAYCALHPDEASALCVESLIEGGDDARLTVTVGFLHVALRDPHAERGSWQEARPREVIVPAQTLGALAHAPATVAFRFPDATREAAADAATPALIHAPVEGRVDVSCTRLAEGAYRVRFTVRNTSPMQAADVDRNAASASALVSCHAVLRVAQGAFVSLLDPPVELESAASTCEHTGAWPVLVGTHGARDTLLASPIILYDYPCVAPESPGDLFDATEIDEILLLRILTMTDEEKREMTAADPRARALLERAECMTPETMQALHGTWRELASASPLTEAPPWHPGDAPLPHIASLRTNGIELQVGDRVRLKPRRTADIMDIALAGRMATIESIERDFEDRVHVAVTIDDDPGRDLGLARMPGHRFFFGVDELELPADRP